MTVSSFRNTLGGFRPHGSAYLRDDLRTCFALPRRLRYPIESHKDHRGHRPICVRPRSRSKVRSPETIDDILCATGGELKTRSPSVLPCSGVVGITDNGPWLRCAPAYNFSPLRHWKVGPGSKVAVVGLGGLGHMAVKLAHALGAEVTVLSQSLAKKDDGLRLGAHHFHATSDPGTYARLRGSFELILNTVSAPIDVDDYLSLLALDGALVNLGAPAEPLSLDVFSLLRGRKSYAGSIIGGIPETQEMLDFCAEHGIGSDSEVITANQINEAFERVLGSNVRYRFVIDIATLK